jgi:tetratricopeptide (TPR) repeat protein
VPTKKQGAASTNKHENAPFARLTQILAILVGTWVLLREKHEQRRKKRRERLSERSGEEKQTSALKVVASSLIVPALLALLVYAVITSSEAMAIGLLTAASAFAAGALVGFLFGIPRTVAQNAGTGAAANDGIPKSLYSPNTNLEQISDWLTKILVGVGLVQLGQIGGGIDDLAAGIEGGLGPNGHAVAVMLMISFAIAGFLSSYMYTRLRLQNALEPLREALKKQEEDLTNALPLVRAQLDPSGETDPTVADLSKALHDASSGIRDEAFYLARNQRRANWRGKEPHEEKRLVDLVIPVFEALVGLDEKKKYHRNHAELGYALKDRESPTDDDYEQARVNLTEAIRRRGDRLRSRFPLYEFNRAFSSIELKLADLDQICEDLKVAAETKVGLKAIRETREVKYWLRRNKSAPCAADLLKKIPPPKKR